MFWLQSLALACIRQRNVYGSTGRKLEMVKVKVKVKVEAEAEVKGLGG